MKTRTQIDHVLFVGLGLIILALLLFFSTVMDPLRVVAQKPQATPQRLANIYRYFFPFIANSCQAYCVGWAVGGNVDGYGVILRTDDSGVTWYRQGTASTIPNISIQGVSAVDALNAWVVGENKILRTYNGGTNWESQKLPDGLPSNVELSQVKALNSQIAFVVGGPSILMRTDDGGTNWFTMPVSSGLPSIHYSDIDAVDATHVWAVGGVISETDPMDWRSGVAILFYDGIQWQPQLLTHPPIDSCGSFIGVSAVDQNVAWAVGGSSCPPYKTENGGALWKTGGPILDANDTNRVVAVTRDLVWIASDNHVYRTLDGGKKWDPTSGCSGGNFCYAISAAGTQYAWVSDAGYSDSRLYRWVNGDHWDLPVPLNTKIWLLSFVGARR